MKAFRSRALLLATSLLTASAVSAPAFAQGVSGEGNQKANTGGIDEIVVTAQRTAQSVLEVPLSIQAISGNQLAESGIRQMSDLQLTTPGFVPSNTAGYNQMFIRGIGNTIFVGADPSVATYIDDVPRVSGTMVNNFVDVERVEVIKGAPGALYGRNATGGAVNIITRQPSTDGIAGKIKASYGEKDTFQASAFLNVPLGENVAWTIAGEYRKHDGYIKNLTPDSDPYTAAMFPGGAYFLTPNATAPITQTPSAIPGFADPVPLLPVGADVYHYTAQETADYLNSGLNPRKSYNREKFWAVSSKLLVRPTDNFKITLAGDYSRKDDDNGNGAYNTTPEWAVGVLANYLQLFAGATPGDLSSLVVPVTRKFTTAQRNTGFVKLTDWGLSATAVLELPDVDLTSITAYRKNKSDFLTEFTYSPFTVYQGYVPLRKNTFSQELRAVSTGSGPLHYILGASYLRNELSGGGYGIILSPAVFLPAGQGSYVAHNWSAYAQLGYDVTDNLSVTVSGRYIHEKNNARSFDPVASQFVPYTLVEKRFLPSATISYQLDGGGNVYARWARGFKAGGIVVVDAIARMDAAGFDPRTHGGIFKGEEVDTFEAGVRAPLMDNKVQVTAAIFYNDYRNIQLGAHARPEWEAYVSIAAVNAGNARSYGAEATITARVAEPLTLGATVGYLNARYKDFKVLDNEVLADINLSGTRMINSPEWQLSFNANLDQPLNDSLRLVGNAVAAYTSDIRWQQSGVPGPNGLPPNIVSDAIGAGYWLVNARLGVRSADDKWELAVYAKNLFNKGYSISGASAGIYGVLSTWGDPRIVGLEASYNF